MQLECGPLARLTLLILWPLASSGATTPEFLTAPTFAAGLSPVGIVSADFNGDGRQDVAVANMVAKRAGHVNLLYGNGSGGFGLPKGSPKMAAPTGIATGDFNGDGRPDIVVSHGVDQGGFDILLNRNGRFDTSTYVAGGTNAQSISVGDFNQDGRTDVVLADSGGLIVFLGHGNGTFSNGEVLASGTQFLQVMAQDINHDGKLDLVAATPSSIQVFLSLGNGNFGSAQVHSFGAAAITTFALGDFNADGQADALVAQAIDASGSSPFFFLLAMAMGLLPTVDRHFPRGSARPHQSSLLTLIVMATLTSC